MTNINLLYFPLYVTRLWQKVILIVFLLNESQSWKSFTFLSVLLILDCCLILTLLCKLQPISGY